MLEAMRQQLANLDLTCNNPELLKSFISPDPAMNDCESGDEDSFVLVDECTEQEKPSRSMDDVLHEMGFDSALVERVVRRFNGDFEKALNALVSSPIRPDSP